MSYGGSLRGRECGGYLGPCSWGDQTFLDYIGLDTLSHAKMRSPSPPTADVSIPVALIVGVMVAVMALTMLVTCVILVVCCCYLRGCLLHSKKTRSTYYTITT
jgi:hypothetical protein